VDLHSGRTGVVVTVPAAADVVERVGAAYAPAAAVGVPPHVTVLYPWLDLDDVTDDDLAALGDLCAAVPAFDVSFERFGRFPGVLWLAPDPVSPFIGLTDAVVERWPQTPPYGGAYDDVTPHLTVMDLDAAGLDASDESAIAGVVGRLSPGLPVRHRVEDVALILFTGDGFSTIARIPLAGV
jgi:2'-5' RNA ligase